MGKLIHEQLTYDVRGVLMGVHRDLKPMLPEHFYQDAQQRLKRHLHTLGLQLGLLANFHGTRLHIQPVRVAR